MPHIMECMMHDCAQRDYASLTTSYEYVGIVRLYSFATFCLISVVPA